MRGDNVKTNDGHCGSNLSGKLSGQLFRDELSIGRSGRICDCLFETLKSLRFSNAGFDFVYSPCVLVIFHYRS
jgi:hypothetical protein